MLLAVAEYPAGKYDLEVAELRVRFHIHAVNCKIGFKNFFVLAAPCEDYAVLTAPFKKLLICQRELYAVGHSGCSQPCHPANSVVHLLVIPWYNAGIELIAKRCSVS